MDAFNYLAVMVSMVLGLGLTQLFAGIGNMVQIRRRVKPYWLHYVWVVLAIGLHLQMWWSFWMMRVVQDWTYTGFAFVLLGPALLVIASHVLLPEMIDGTIDTERHYYDTRGVFFCLLAAAGAWALVLEAVMGLRSLLVPVRAVQLAGIGLMLLCAWSPNRRVHAVCTLLVIAMLISTTLLTRYRLGQAGLVE
ncbi:hypothetical protein [Lysobacter panacisoli]|uniref:GGDEF domain-containing protein n=1 Tax=Lysobacter panacisoli TaxID=1255263 RepID=A0ABP9L9D4_9GAMM|nr:hypothetical protein [Lysobacter panacisoli]